MGAKSFPFLVKCCFVALFYTQYDTSSRVTQEGKCAAVSYCTRWLRKTRTMQSLSSSGNVFAGFNLHHNKDKHAVQSPLLGFKPGTPTQKPAAKRRSVQPKNFLSITSLPYGCVFNPASAASLCVHSS